MLRRSPSTRGTNTTTAIVLTHLVVQSNRPLSRGVIAVAPCTIRVFDRLSEHATAQAGKDVVDVLGYAACTSNPLVSGAFVPFTMSWPRMLVFVGTADNLVGALREVEQRLKALGRPLELVEYDERPHGWWVMPHLFPENVQDAVERMAQFILH